MGHLPLYQAETATEAAEEAVATVEEAADNNHRVLLHRAPNVCTRSRGAAR